MFFIIAYFIPVLAYYILAQSVIIHSNIWDSPKTEIENCYPIKSPLSKGVRGSYLSPSPCGRGKDMTEIVAGLNEVVFPPPLAGGGEGEG